VDTATTLRYLDGSVGADGEALALPDGTSSVPLLIQHLSLGYRVNETFDVRLETGLLWSALGRAELNPLGQAALAATAKPNQLEWNQVGVWSGWEIELPWESALTISAGLDGTVADLFPGGAASLTRGTQGGSGLGGLVRLDLDHAWPEVGAVGTAVEFETLLGGAPAPPEGVTSWRFDQRLAWESRAGLAWMTRGWLGWQFRAQWQWVTEFVPLQAFQGLNMNRVVPSDTRRSLELQLHTGPCAVVPLGDTLTLQLAAWLNVPGQRATYRSSALTVALSAGF
jgi:hypothetical protein